MNEHEAKVVATTPTSAGDVLPEATKRGDEPAIPWSPLVVEPPREAPAAAGEGTETIPKTMVVGNQLSEPSQVSEETREASSKDQQVDAPYTPATSSGVVKSTKSKVKKPGNQRRSSTSSQEAMDDVDEGTSVQKTLEYETTTAPSGTTKVKASLLGGFTKKGRYHPAPRILRRPKAGIDSLMSLCFL